jgi:hypothetical protein
VVDATDNFFRKHIFQEPSRRRGCWILLLLE